MDIKLNSLFEEYSKENLALVLIEDTNSNEEKNNSSLFNYIFKINEPYSGSESNFPKSAAFVKYRNFTIENNFSFYRTSLNDGVYKELKCDFIKGYKYFFSDNKYLYFIIYKKQKYCKNE